MDNASGIWLCLCKLKYVSSHFSPFFFPVFLLHLFFSTWFFLQPMFFSPPPVFLSTSCFFSAQPVDRITGRPAARTDEPERETQTKTVHNPRTWIFRLIRERFILPNSWLDSRRTMSRNCSSEKFHTPSTFQHQKTSFQDKCVLVPVTLRIPCVGLKKSRWLLESTILRCRYRCLDFFQTSRCLTRSSLRFEEDHPKFELQKEGSKDDRFHRGRQIACMIYEYFRVTGPHETFLNFTALISVTFYVVTMSKDLRLVGMKSCCRPTKYFRTTCWRSDTRCEHGSLISSKLCLHCTNKRFN